jgi:hypothetical protein
MGIRVRMPDLFVARVNARTGDTNEKSVLVEGSCRDFDEHFRADVCVSREAGGRAAYF